MKIPTFLTNAPGSVIDFVRRRRTGLSIVVGTIGTAYYVGKYAITKMSEMAQLAQSQALDREK